MKTISNPYLIDKNKIRVKANRQFYNRIPFAMIVWDFHNSNNKWRKGYIVHHIDKNALNNNIENLQLLSWGEHSAVHNSGENNPMFGRNHSEEARQAIARKGEKNHFYGKHFTEEHKRKISESNLGKKLSDIHRQRLVEAWVGQRKKNEANSSK